MSTGRFVRSRYEMDGGNIVNVRVQPETIAATIGGTANAAPTGAITAGLPSAKVNKGRREQGIGTRYVNCVWDAGGAPADYDERTPFSIAVLTPATFAGAGPGVAVGYLGGTGTITSAVGESVK